jgi:thiol-disulfide isomerase/thioredoxin
MKSITLPVLLALCMTCAQASDAPLTSATLAGTDGQTHRIDDWKGAVRIVNFWATWCAPCRYELPVLSAARKQWHARGVEVIGVAVDQASDVQAFLGAAGTGYPVLIAEKEGQALMRTSGNAYASLPFTVLIDRNGVIVHRHQGIVDAHLLDQWLEQLHLTTKKGAS